MGHQSYVLLCTEITLSNPPVVISKSSCDVHILRSPCPRPSNELVPHFPHWHHPFHLYIYQICFFYFNKIIDFIVVALDNMFERFCWQNPLIIFKHPACDCFRNQILPLFKSTEFILLTSIVPLYIRNC